MSGERSVEPRISRNGLCVVVSRVVFIGPPFLIRRFFGAGLLTGNLNPIKRSRHPAFIEDSVGRTTLAAHGRSGALRVARRGLRRGSRRAKIGGGYLRLLVIFSLPSRHAQSKSLGVA